MPLFCRLVVVSFLLISAACQAYAQDIEKRALKSPDWARYRKPAARPASKKPRPVYKSFRVEKNVIRKPVSKPPPSKPAQAKAAKTFTDIGITTWKLRPALAGEAGYMFPILDESGKQRFWLADRVAMDAGFKQGDKVRFAVEATMPGYLYVFDRETRSDGTMGKPKLIFPDSLDQDNWVGPGMIADIPDQGSTQPYFDMVSKAANFSGELLTIVLSRTPITRFEIDSDYFLQNVDELVNMEVDSEAEILSRTDTIDRIYTVTESKSACGMETRDLQRVRSPGKPCRKDLAGLTDEDPWPQSIYRVKAVSGQPAVAFLRLAVR